MTTKEDIERIAKEKGITPKEVLKNEANKDSIAPETEAKEVRLPDMQHLIVTLADGRRGVFTGPALVTKAELILSPPRIASLDFSEPKPMSLPEPIKEEPANENKGIEAEGSK